MFHRNSSAYNHPFARSTSACTIVSSGPSSITQLSKAPTKERDFSHNASLITLCDEDAPDTIDLKSFYTDRASAVLSSSPQPECVEKNSMVWNRRGERVILDNDFERRVERERHLRMSLDSESCALLQLSSKSSFFRSSSYRKSAKSTPFTTTPLPQPHGEQGRRRNVFVSCFRVDTNNDTPSTNSQTRRDKISKLFQDTGSIALKIVAVPAVILFDLVGSIFG